MNHDLICRLAADDKSNGCKNPVRAQVGHRMLPLDEPLAGELFKARNKVEHKELELEEEIIPIWHFGVVYCSQGVD